jgi:hypothetical protein
MIIIVDNSNDRYHLYLKIQKEQVLCLEKKHVNTLQPYNICNAQLKPRVNCACRVVSICLFRKNTTLQMLLSVNCLSQAFSTASHMELTRLGIEVTQL